MFPLIAFFFESYPRFLNRNCGVDVWTHLLYLKEFKKKNRIPEKIEGNFLIPGKYDYPPMFILILSRFPFKIVEKFEFLFSPFFDSIHVLLIFWVSYYITNSLLISLITQALYIVTPIIIVENSSATPRSLGYTLLTLTFVSIFFYQNNLGLSFLIASIIAGTFIFLSHRFTAQGFLFFSITFSIIFRSPIYIFIFALSFLIALIVSDGFYLTVLRGHIGNLIFWYKNIKYRFYHQIKGELKAKNHKDFVFRIYNEFLKFPPFILAITNPWTMIIFPLLLFYLPKEPILFKLFIWVSVSYVLSLITLWIPRLRFLGEGQRYLELSAFPAALLSANFLINIVPFNYRAYSAFLYILIALLSILTIIVIQRKAIIKDQLRSLTPDLLRMFDYLEKLKNKPALLCLPHQITTNTIYHTGSPVFVNADYKDINKISDVYPYLKKPIRSILKQHKLDAILLNEEFATIKDLNLKKFKELKRYGSYVLLKLN